MLLSITIARRTLSKYCWSIAGLNLFSSAVFLLPIANSSASTAMLFFLLGIAAFSGFLVGIALTFRLVFGSTSGVLAVIYIQVISLLFSSGAAALAGGLTGHKNYLLYAIGINASCAFLTLFAGMRHEANRLGCYSRKRDQWKTAIERHLEYSTRRVFPSLTSESNDSCERPKSLLWMVAIGSANIPLLFELYGGGRANAVYFAWPLLTGTIAYLNFRKLGPALLRLLLLRKLETEVGYRFQNADYEQIQELRRGFFLAKWLMKDYRPPQPVADSSPVATAPRQEQKRKRRR